MRRIAIIPGDGIGRDITAEAVKVLQAVLERSGLEMVLDQFAFNTPKSPTDSIGLPADQIETFRREYDAIFVGALGDPQSSDRHPASDLVLKLITQLDLYVFYRPVKLLEERFCPLKDKRPEHIDFVLFGETSEGDLTRIAGSFKRGTGEEICYSQSLVTRRGVERIIRHALEYTRTHGRKKLALACKPNAIFRDDDIWERTLQEVGMDYPGVEKSSLTVRSLGAQLLRCPENFEVIVTGNIYSHLLSDIGAQLQGGMGLAASAYLNPGKISLFTPAPGANLKPAGPSIANPLGAISSIAMMLEALGFEQETRWINQAVKYTLETNNVTRDMSGRLTAAQVGDFVANQIRKGTW
jgi:3-isopropylmalate dehydrogenase